MWKRRKQNQHVPGSYVTEVKHTLSHFAACRNDLASRTVILYFRLLQVA